MADWFSAEGGLIAWVASDHTRNGVQLVGVEPNRTTFASKRLGANVALSSAMALERKGFR